MTTKYVVRTYTDHASPEPAYFWLRGTTWAYHLDRATRHGTPADAQSALEDARKFMHRDVYRRAVILPVED